MKIQSFTNEGVKASEVELPKVFAVTPNPKFLSDMVVRFFANARIYTANTKKRDERRGGGKKPWKQKGTGRARAGSSRSPIWRKGGIVFGPRKDRNYSVKVNKKEMKRAMAQAIAFKASEKNGVVVMDSLKIEAKTKQLVALIAKLKLNSKVLIITPKADENVKRAAKNLQTVKHVVASGVSIIDVLDAGTVIVVGDALKTLQEQVTL
jgi:large subunit ribosomal protein L4